MFLFTKKKIPPKTVCSPQIGFHGQKPVLGQSADLGGIRQTDFSNFVDFSAFSLCTQRFSTKNLRLFFPSKSLEQRKGSQNNFSRFFPGSWKFSASVCVCVVGRGEERMQHCAGVNVLFLPHHSIFRFPMPTGPDTAVAITMCHFRAGKQIFAARSMRFNAGRERNTHLLLCQKFYAFVVRRPVRELRFRGLT